MYDQVPPRLVNEFIKYVVEGNISVVHLEREAVLLQALEQAKQLHAYHPAAARLELMSWNSPRSPAQGLPTCARFQLVKL